MERLSKNNVLNEFWSSSLKESVTKALMVLSIVFLFFFINLSMFSGIFPSLDFVNSKVSLNKSAYSLSNLAVTSLTIVF